MNMLLVGLGSVRIVTNCDLGLENAALGLWPWAAFSRPRSQFLRDYAILLHILIWLSAMLKVWGFYETWESLPQWELMVNEDSENSPDES